MKRITLTAFVLASACSAPDDALVHSCKTGMLSLFTECEVRAKVLRQPRSAYIDGNTKNFKVRVSATFTVVKGRVAVAVPGCGEIGRAEVSPEHAAAFECEAVLNRSTYRFEVEAKPIAGDAEGFAGKLRFRAI
jgi:hypothetical protein